MPAEILPLKSERELTIERVSMRPAPRVQGVDRAEHMVLGSVRADFKSTGA